MKKRGSSDRVRLPGQLEAALSRAEVTDVGYGSSAEPPLAIAYTEALDNGRTLSISPQVEALLGYSQDEWMADPMLWVQLIHPEDRERVEQACWESNRAEEPFRSEYRMIARDGLVRWFHDEAEVVRGSAGQRLCWQGVMLDITAQRKAEQGPGSPGP